MGIYYRNDPNTIISINGADYVYRGYDYGRTHMTHRVTGLPYRVEQPDGSFEMPSDEQFDDMLEQDDCTVKSGHPIDKAKLLNDVSELTVAQAMQIDPGVEKMHVQMVLLDDDGCPDGLKATRRRLPALWTPEHLEKYGPHDDPRTVMDWRLTRGSPGHRHPRLLIRHRGRAFSAIRGGEVEREIQWKHALAYKTVEGGIPQAYDLYLSEMELVNAGTHPVHKAPDRPYEPISEKTFRRRCDAIDCAETDFAKRGPQAVEQFWSGAGKPLTADFAMHRVIVDHTRLDAFVVDDERAMTLGRPWLTIAIDVRTRAIVGHLISFMDPSAWTVGEILRRMAMPKRPPTEMARRYPVLRRLRGRPTELIIDNAVEFRSFMLEAAARGIGFQIRFCPIRSPRYRAIVERALGTLNRLICSELPGRTIPIEDARRLDYDAEKHAVLIMDEIEGVVNAVVAEYNTSPHDAHGGRQPAAVFEEEASRTGILNVRDLQSFVLETMDVVRDVQLDAGGLTRWGLRYCHIERVAALLADLTAREPRGRRRARATATVELRYNPADISRVWIWNPVALVYVELVCDDEDYATGMPLAFHLELVREAKRKRDSFNTKAERAAFRAKRVAAIRAISPDAKAAARRRLGVLYEIPRLKRIVGTIVDHEIRSPETADFFDGYVACDQANLTALDMDILSPRTAKDLERLARQQDAEVEAYDDAPPERSRRGRPGPTAPGGYR